MTKPTPHEKVALIAFMQKLETTTPCNSCVNWDCGNCRLYGEKIPDDMKDKGCENWVFAIDSPPF